MKYYRVVLNDKYTIEEFEAPDVPAVFIDFGDFDKIEVTEVGASE